MADPSIRIASSAKGRFYVDETCCDCDLCRQTAPANMTRDDDRGWTFVSRQPGSPEELEQMTQALEECPTDSIGDDGEAP